MLAPNASQRYSKAFWKCADCGLIWILHSERLIIYDFEGERLCSECVQQRERASAILRMDHVCHKNPNHWTRVFVEIAEFSCCRCEQEIDKYHALEDAEWLLRIRMYVFPPVAQHRFCAPCFLVVKECLEVNSPLKCRSSNCLRT